MPTQDGAEPDPLNLERRNAERKHVIQRVRILADNRQVEAVMLDISETGVQLQLLASVELPRTFVLRFQEGVVRKVLKRWHFGMRVGVEFLPEPVEPPTLTAPVGDLSHIRSWLEQLRTLEVAELLLRLAHDDYFGSTEIQAAARDFDLAFHRLRQAIQHRLQG